MVKYVYSFFLMEKNLHTKAKAVEFYVNDLRKGGYPRKGRRVR